MAKKLVKHVFRKFSPPPPKKKKLLAVQKILVKNEKNQSCLKLPEMARKCFENGFWTFSPPPKKYLGGVINVFKGILFFGGKGAAKKSKNGFQPNFFAISGNFEQLQFSLFSPYF